MVKMMFWQEKMLDVFKEHLRWNYIIGNQNYQQDYTVSSLKEFVDRVL